MLPFYNHAYLLFCLDPWLQHDSFASNVSCCVCEYFIISYCWILWYCMHIALSIWPFTQQRLFEFSTSSSSFSSAWIHFFFYSSLPFLDFKVSACIVFWKSTTLFSKVHIILYFCKASPFCYHHHFSILAILNFCNISLSFEYAFF